MRIDESLSFLEPLKKEKTAGFISVLCKRIIGLEYVILFGSHARGMEKGTSDIDLLAVTEEEVPRELRGELCSCFEERNADLVFYTLETLKKSECLFAREVRKDGIVIWKRKEIPTSVRQRAITSMQKPE